MSVAAPERRFLALGDSYTIGEGVASSDRWPEQLVAELREHGLAVADPLIVATTGWTTDELLRGIEIAHPRGSFALVSLLIGLNNQYRGYDLAEYREQFRFLLDKAMGYAGGDANRVVVLSIPDWGVTPFAAESGRDVVPREIDSFNAANREESEKAGVHYVDITPISRQAVDDPDLIAPDGLHPSAKMYDLWVEKVVPVVREIFIGSKKEKP